MKALLSALQTWFTTGKCGGLRRLTAVSYHTDNIVKSSSAFVDAVAKFCPQIEYLDGFQKAFFDGRIRCHEKWLIPLDMWRTFNERCTRLREFSWQVVPLADDFFRVFGEYSKPALTTLILTANLSWDYRQFIKSCGGKAVSSTSLLPGYGDLARQVGWALRGCPALKVLMVEICYKNSSATLCFDHNLFGDDFWESAANYCRLLEHIEVENDSVCLLEIQTLTDRSLTSITRLERLTFAKLRTGFFTAKGIFKYICAVSEQTNTVGKQLSVGIGIGGLEQHTAIPSFYREVTALLRLLSETDDIDRSKCTRKLVLLIANPNRSVPSGWCDVFMREELNPLLVLVKETQPTLQVQVRLDSYAEDQYICGIQLDWRRDSPSRPRYQHVNAKDSEDSEDY